MNRVVKKPEQSFVVIPEGTYLGFVSVMRMLGWIEDTWEGKASWNEKVLIGYKINAEGEPFHGAVLTDVLNLTYSEKGTLLKRLNAMVKPGELPFGLELKEFLGRPVSVTVTHKKSGT